MRWARRGAYHTRDFEDVVAWLAQPAWLAQQMAKTPITGLLRECDERLNHLAARLIRYSHHGGFGDVAMLAEGVLDVERADAAVRDRALVRLLDLR